MLTESSVCTVEQPRASSPTVDLFVALDRKWGRALGAWGAAEPSQRTPRQPQTGKTPRGVSRRHDAIGSSKFGVMQSRLPCASSSVVDLFEGNTALNIMPPETRDGGESHRNFMSAMSSVAFDESFFRLAIASEESGAFQTIQLLLPMFVGTQRQHHRVGFGVKNKQRGHCSRAVMSMLGVGMGPLRLLDNDDGETSCVSPSAENRPLVGTPLRVSVDTTREGSTSRRQQQQQQQQPSSNYDPDEEDICWHAAPSPKSHAAPSPSSYVATDEQRIVVVLPHFPDDDTIHASLHASEMRMATTIATTRENLVRCVEHEMLLRAYFEFETYDLLRPLFALEAAANHSLVGVWLEEQSTRHRLLAQLSLVRLEEASRLAIEGACWSCCLEKESECAVAENIQRVADSVVHDANVSCEQRSERWRPSAQRFAAPPTTNHCRVAVRDAIDSWRNVYCPCLALDAHVRLFLSGIHLAPDPKLPCVFSSIVLSSHPSSLQAALLHEADAQFTIFAGLLQLELDSADVWRRETELEHRDWDRIVGYASYEHRRVSIEVQLRVEVAKEMRLSVNEPPTMSAGCADGDEDAQSDVSLRANIASAMHAVYTCPPTAVQRLLDCRIPPMTFRLYTRLRLLDYTEEISRRALLSHDAYWGTLLATFATTFEASHRERLQLAEINDRLQIVTGCPACNDLEQGETAVWCTVCCGAHGGPNRRWIAETEGEMRAVLTIEARKDYEARINMQEAHARWDLGCVASALISGRRYTTNEPSPFALWEQHRRNQLSLLEMQCFVQTVSLCRFVARELTFECLLREGSSSFLSRTMDATPFLLEQAALARRHEVEVLVRQEDSDRGRVIAAARLAEDRLALVAQMTHGVALTIRTLHVEAMVAHDLLRMECAEGRDRLLLAQEAESELALFHVRLAEPRHAAAASGELHVSSGSCAHLAQQLLASMVQNHFCSLDVARIAFS